MAIYVLIPQEVEAIQWTGFNKAELINFVGVKNYDDVGTMLITNPPQYKAKVFSKTLHSWMKLDKGDYVIKNENGLFVYTEDVFKETYQLKQPTDIYGLDRPGM